jgi:hypothetical protein
MVRLQLVDLYNRGLKDFDGLSQIEKDVFVVNDLDVYYEMEGGFEDYLLNGAHEAELSWLGETLERILDQESKAVLANLRRLGEAGREAMAPLCRRFYGLRHQRWSRLVEYLRSHDTEVDD